MTEPEPEDLHEMHLGTTAEEHRSHTLWVRQRIDAQHEWQRIRREIAKWALIQTAAMALSAIGWAMWNGLKSVLAPPP